MKFRAEFHCYHCGYLAARVEGDQGQRSTKPWRIIPARGHGVLLQRGRAPRCGRCGGPLYLDEVEMVQVRVISSDRDDVADTSGAFASGDQGGGPLPQLEDSPTIRPGSGEILHSPNRNTG